MKKLMRHPTIYAALALLSACVTQTPTPSTHALNAEQHEAKLQLANNWQIEGKIAFRSTENNASGYLKWVQIDDNYAINLHGPFGQGSTQINGTSETVTLILPDQTLQSNTPQALLYQHTGWNLPVKELRFWAIGRAAPGTSTKTQENNYLSQLQQSGWTINYDKHKQYQQLWLPGKITLQKDGLKIIILAKQWTVNQSQ